MDRKDMIAKAEELGLEFKKNISNDALAELIDNAEDKELEKIADEAEKVVEELVEEKKESTKKVEEPKGKLTPVQVKQKAIKEATKLVRCIVTPMDKNKAEWSGELVSSGNSMTGRIKKYIQFGTPWHIPQILLDKLQEAKTLVFVDRKTPKGTVKDRKEIPAYSIQILPDLTQEELDRIVKENK